MRSFSAFRAEEPDLLHVVIPAKAGIHPSLKSERNSSPGWVPAFAGMTAVGWRHFAQVGVSVVFYSCVAVFALTGVAHAEVKGTFIGPGVYATADGCAKWKAVEAGGDRSIETVPDVLTEDGFKGWEGACTFRSITEKEPGRMWQAAMDCHEGATEGPESDIFEKMPDGSIKMTVMDSATTLVRCDAEKGK